jgi:hypothetical protein
MSEGIRHDALSEVQAGTRRSPSPLTLAEAADAWLKLARAGVVPEAGERYKPSALRGYEAALRLRVLPELGGVRLSDITQDATGAQPSSPAGARCPSTRPPG